MQDPSPPPSDDGGDDGDDDDNRKPSSSSWGLRQQQRKIIAVDDADRQEEEEIVISSSDVVLSEDGDDTATAEECVVTKTTAVDQNYIIGRRRHRGGATAAAAAPLAAHAQQAAAAVAADAAPSSSSSMAKNNQSVPNNNGASHLSRDNNAHVVNTGRGGGGGARAHPSNNNIMQKSVVLSSQPTSAATSYDDTTTRDDTAATTSTFTVNIRHQQEPTTTPQTRTRSSKEQQQQQQQQQQQPGGGILLAGAEVEDILQQQPQQKKVAWSSSSAANAEEDLVAENNSRTRTNSGANPPTWTRSEPGGMEADMEDILQQQQQQQQNMAASDAAGKHVGSGRSPLRTRSEPGIMAAEVENILLQQQQQKKKVAADERNTNTPPPSNWTKIRLKDILRTNPLENEAETLILRAIEEEDASAEAASSSSSSSSLTKTTGNNNKSFSLLPNVPADSASLFSASTSEHQNPDNQDPNDASTTNATTTTDRRRGHGPRPPLLSQRRGIRHAAGGAPSLLRREKSFRYYPTTRRPTLAAMLSEMYEEMEKLDESSDDYFSQQQADDGTEEFQQNVSSGRLFAQNAQLLFRGQKSSNNNNNQQRSERMTTKKRPTQPTDSSEIIGGSKAMEEGNSSQFVSSSLLRGNGQMPDDDDDEGASGVGGATAADDSDAINPQGRSRNASKKNWRNRRQRPLKMTMNPTKEFKLLVGRYRSSIKFYIRLVLLVIIPALAVSVGLFLGAGNPPTGRIDLDKSNNKGTLLVNQSGDTINPNQASISWWIIFVFVRQVFTFSLAKLLQFLVIDFLCLSTRWFVRIFGNLVTLLIVQSRGWPFLLFIWSLLDFALLHGPSPFASHWMCWQDFAPVFSAENPSGAVTSSHRYTVTLAVAVGVSAATAVKRQIVGLYLGKQTYANYAEDLTKVVKKILVLSKVATVAQDCIADAMTSGSISRRYARSTIGRDISSHDGEKRRSFLWQSMSTIDDTSPDDFVIEPVPDLDRVVLTSAQRARVNELLGAWEDPEEKIRAEENASVSCILQFRQTLSLLDNRFMFSIAFGDCITRDAMILSSQEVYRGLLCRSPNPDLLNFDVLIPLTEQLDSSLDQKKLKELIRMLRPDREGNLTLLEFVKSVDRVFKEAKLLRASIKNSERIDRELDHILNIGFYSVIGYIVLSLLGLNPTALLISLTSVIIGFAFAIGPSAARIFDGILFILLRRPYNIGDVIHVGNRESDPNPSGSWGWTVTDVNLYQTRAISTYTNELATFSNGSLSGSRVINQSWSPNGRMYIYLKFSVDVPYARVKIFEGAVRQFVLSRPRDWASFLGFRATRVAADLGYIEYVIVLDHREAWANIGALLFSKAEISSFCLELSKKLDMRFRSPPLPVDLALVPRSSGSSNGQQQQHEEEEGRKSVLEARGGSGSPKLSPLPSDDALVYSEVAALFGQDSTRFK